MAITAKNGVLISSIGAFKGILKTSISAVNGIVIGSGGSSGPILSFSDAFTRADNASLGPNWTEAAGDASIVLNSCQFQTTGYAEICEAFTGTACSSVNQYVLVSWVAAENSYPSIVLRYTDASSPLYQIFFWVTENQLTWVTKANAADGTQTLIETITGMTVDTTDRWGVTIEGVGNATVVRCWKNPTGDIPTTLSNWGGAPTATFTANPSSPVNTGNYVGIGGEQNFISSIIMDNFFGGNF